jgi:ribosomal protein S18 acetylase RimI-like enzyme
MNYKTSHLIDCYDVDVKSYYFPWTEKEWGKLSGLIIRVFLSDDKVIGFYVFKVVNDTIVVKKLCVHPEYRGLGIGNRLYQDLYSMAEKYKKKILVMLLHEENENRDFLIKRGWKGRMEKDAFPNADGYLFTKEIL